MKLKETTNIIYSSLESRHLINTFEKFWNLLEKGWRFEFGI